MVLEIPDLGSFYRAGNGAPTFEIKSGPMIRFLKGSVLKKMNVAANEFGLYSFATVGSDRSIKFNFLTGPKHMMKAATNCTWTPKGKMRVTPSEVTIYPYEIEMEQCPAEFANCFRAVLGTGNSYNDLTATAQGQAMLDQMLSLISDSMQNSVYDILTFSNHSVIADSNTNGWWKTGQGTDPTEWADFYTQETAQAVEGHFTQVIAAKTAGDAHYNAAIGSLYNTSGAFTGSDITDVFKLVEAAARPKLRTYLNSRPGIFLVDSTTFNEYEDYIIATYPGGDAAFRYALTREDTNIRPMNGVLRYKSHYVVRNDELSEFDRLTGAITNSVTLVAPGNFGVAFDVASIENFPGAGLVVQQSPDMRDKGLTSMYSRIELGAAILDSELVAHGSKITTPS